MSAAGDEQSDVVVIGGGPAGSTAAMRVIVSDANHNDVKESGTLHIELGKLSSAADTLEREHPVVFYCRVGGRSTMAAQALRAAGFRAHSMSGGLQRWAQESRPLSPEGGYVADH